MSVIPARLAGRVALLGMVGVLAAATSGPQGQDPPPSHRPVRVLLGSVRGDAAVTMRAGWRLVDAGGREREVARPEGIVSIERRGRSLRVREPGGRVSDWITGSVTIDPAGPDDVIDWSGRTWRGAIRFIAADTATLVVNEVRVEEYLRGVVPLEVGAMRTEEHAAVEAQAVAARSFAYSRMEASGARAWDLTARESDQVYGGSGVETFLGDLAVAATAGWVLTVNDRVVIAPYHAVCGGTTAAPSEVWRGGTDDFLRAVSDEGPEAGRAWCDISPRFAWERRIAADALVGAMTRYAPTYVPSSPIQGIRQVRNVRREPTTPSGRVSAVAVETNAGTVHLRGNDIRFVLRPDGVEVLPSTRFDVEEERAPDGSVRAWVLRGRGHGHGVGLCQWGAIGRARAGHDFRAILKAYYPGAELSRAPW